MKIALLILGLFIGPNLCAPQQRQLDRYDRINNNRPNQINNYQERRKITELPTYDPYQPEKKAQIPIEIGERRCDNSYNGEVLPCLLRPDVPPFSYSTERAYNMEYKK